MKTSLSTLFFFSLGIAAALLKIVPNEFYQPKYSEYALYFLLFLVGISVGADPHTRESIRNLKGKILFVPLCIVLGSLMGGMISSLVLPSLSMREAMAVSAGMGYYSLSSIIITKLHTETLGVIALLSNILREVTTLFLAPVLAKYFGKLAPIASGGATTMDTTLPVITISSGKDYTIIAVVNGIILSLIVPFLVSFILS